MSYMPADLIDDSAVLLARNETQAAAIRKLQELLKRLRAVKAPHAGGMVFLKKEVDERGICRLEIAIHEGLRVARTATIEIAVLQDDYRTTVLRLKDEYLALCDALFLKTYAPDLYNPDVSPVTLAEATSMNAMDLT